MNYTIKKITPQDFDLAKDLMLDWSEGKNVPEDFYLRNLLENKAFHIFVALDGEKVIAGLTGYELDMFYKTEKEFFFYELEVMEEYRNQGIAKALANAAIDYCKENNFACMYVGTEEDNIPAQKTYLSTGGKEEKVMWYTYEFKKTE